MNSEKFQIIENRDRETNIKALIPSKEDEIERIKLTLIEMKWFKENDYYPSMIKLPSFCQNLAEETSGLEKNEALKRLGDFENEFWQQLEYSLDDYEKERLIIENQLLENWNGIVAVIKDWEKWGFKIFENYLVYLTKYGTNGSYRPENGRIILRIDSTDIWNTIIHEIIHVGIENCLVQKFKLEHWEKELLVDLICKNILDLDNYQIQIKSNERNLMNKFIDKYSVKNLPLAVENYLIEKKKTE